MTPERLNQIEDDAIAGKLPDRITVQVLCATIRVCDNTIADQAQMIIDLKRTILRKPLTPVEGNAILGDYLTRFP